MKLLIRLLTFYIPGKKRRHASRQCVKSFLEKWHYAFCLIKHSIIARQRFDLIVSLGDRCQLSHQLRRNYCQIKSYPFDWLRKQSIKTLSALLKDDFKGFLDRKKLIIFKNARPHIRVRHTSLGIEFIHDFKGPEIDTDLKEVMSKYNRRISRMNHHIRISRKVLFIYRSSIAQTKDIKDLYQTLVQKYQEQEIVLWWIRPKRGLNRLVSTNLISNVYQKEFDANAFYGIYKTSRWEGNDILYGEVFKSVGLSFAGMIRERFQK